MRTIASSSLTLLSKRTRLARSRIADRRKMASLRVLQRRRLRATRLLSTCVALAAVNK
jgi:hypothetical protein